MKQLSKILAVVTILCLLISALAVPVSAAGYQQPRFKIGKFTTRPLIDGVLDDACWHYATTRELTYTRLAGGEGWFWDPFVFMVEDYGHFPDDGEGQMYFGWDEEYFYFALEVDDERNTNNSALSEDLWKGDCIQMQIGASVLAKRFELGFAISQFGGPRSIGYQWAPIPKDFTVSGTTQMTDETDDSVVYFVARDNNKKTTTYEIAISLDHIGAKAGAVGNKIPFAFAVHLYSTEGNGYGYYLEWADGVIGNASTKDLTVAAILEFAAANTPSDTSDTFHVYDNACDATCNVCHAQREATHAYQNGCDADCDACGTERLVSHTYGEWENYDNFLRSVCAACGAAETRDHHWTVDVSNVEEGDTAVDVVVTLHTAEPLLNGGFVLAYDAELMDVVIPVKNGRPTPNTMSQLPNCEVNPNKARVVRVGFMHTVEEETIVLKVTFKLKEPATIDDVYLFEAYATQLVGDDGTVLGYDYAADGVYYVASESAVITHVYDNTCDTTCNVCGATCEIVHTYDNSCDGICNVCDHDRTATIAHTYAGECDSICDVCGSEREASDEHTFDDVFDTFCNFCDAYILQTAPYVVQLIDGGAEVAIIGLEGDHTELTIPSELGGKPVVAIAAEAFKDNTVLVEVVVPDTVKTIDTDAFAGCTALEVVVLPEGLTTVGNGAFKGDKALLTAKLPSTVTTIGAGAFDGCLRLSQLVIPAETTMIGAGVVANSGVNLIVFNGSSERWNELVSDFADEFKTVAVLFTVLSKNGVSVGYENGTTFNVNVSLSAEAVNDEKVLKRLEQFLKKAPFEIHLTENGEAVQPDSTVNVTIPIPEDMREEDCKVVYVDEDGNVTEMDAERMGNSMCFKTDHFSVYAVVTSNVSTKTGDVNSDGNIDSTDARLTLQYFVGSVSEDAINLVAANVNGDSAVDSTDARLILQYFVGSITEFPTV